MDYDDDPMGPITDEELSDCLNNERACRELSEATCSACKHYDPCNYLLSGPEGCVETCEKGVGDFSYILANDLPCDKFETQSEPTLAGAASADLLDCPFCGGEASYEEVENLTGRISWSVGCDDEDCIGWQSTKSYARKTDACRRWNLRRAKKRANKPLGRDPFII